MNINNSYVNRDQCSSIYNEALKIRQKIESIADSDCYFFSPNFPINACKMASIVFCYHMQLVGYGAPMKVVFGVSKKRTGDVGHWWVETQNYLIDLTADQFNIIEDNELSYKIRAKRKYLPVYCCLEWEAPHNQVFKRVEKEAFVWNLSEIGGEIIENLESFYARLSL